MNKRFTLSVLFILMIFIGTTIIDTVSAEKAAGVSAPQASTTIVISQVYSGGGSSVAGVTYKNDYVELFNISANPVSLNGYALQYGSAAGNFGNTATQIFAIPDGVTLQPGQHYLIQLGMPGTAGADLPVTPDATSTNLSMAATSGKVALTNTTTALGCGATATPCALPDSRIVDVVSYGVSNNAEGGVTVNNGVALTNTQGSVRNGNGCTDTDNNNNDFTVVTNPVPRNTTSPLTPCGSTPAPTPDANADFNGDGKTDYTVTRNNSGAKTWYTSINGTGAFSGVGFGAAGDVEVPEDYDGDGKDDVAVYRPGSPSAFYIIQSSNSTIRSEAFGQTGDDPRVVADYDGDNKADIAVYRPSSGQSYYYIKRSTDGGLTSAPWGGGLTTRPNVGDYDGDNKADFCVHYNGGSGNGVFAVQKSTGGNEFISFGLITDALAPGDYDGDGKSDFTVVRNSNGVYLWYTLNRANVVSGVSWGAAGDTIVPGDYDGDGKQDVAVWRPGTGGAASAFYARGSQSGALQSFGFGAATDYPVANWYVH